MSMLVPTEPAPEPRDAPDLLRCQHGVDGPRGERCSNRPIAIERGASICADCIDRLRQRGTKLLLTHLEKPHG